MNLVGGKFLSEFGWCLQFQLFQVNSWLEPSLVLLPCFWFSPRLHSITIHYITKPLPPRLPPRLFCLCFLELLLFRIFVVFFRIFTFPRPSCSSSIASSFTMFSCFTFSSTWKRKKLGQQGCYFRSVHMWLLSKLTSNSLIWTSCGLMCDSWLNVFTCNANLISQSTLSANNAKFKCED